jgi:hypothetical protein
LPSKKLKISELYKNCTRSLKRAHSWIYTMADTTFPIAIMAETTLPIATMAKATFAKFTQWHFPNLWIEATFPRIKGLIYIF